MAKDKTMLQRIRRAKKDSFRRVPYGALVLLNKISFLVICCAEVVSCSPPRELLHAAWPIFSLYPPLVSAALRQILNRCICEETGNASVEKLASLLNGIFAVGKKSETVVN